jgi:biotin carboxyl carrier protein
VHPEGGVPVECAAHVDGQGVDVAFGGRAYRFDYTQPPSADESGAAAAGVATGRVTAPMPGKIVNVAVAAGDAVAPHALLVVLEAMKMEHRIEASAAGAVKAILVEKGQIVTAGTPLVELA